jgi:ribosomal-protein-alanine N-acetyltransferase
VLARGAAGSYRAAAVPAPPLLRLANAADLPALLRLERAAFESPWPDGAFEQELHHPQAQVWLAYLPEEAALGAESGAEPAGYVDFWLVGPEASLMNVAVHPRARRRGVAQALLRHMLEVAREADAEQVFLEVRASNEPALGLYRELGFQQIGIRKRYYRDNGEDALVLQLPLDEPPAGV